MQDFASIIKAEMARQGVNANTPQNVRDEKMLAFNQSQGRDPIMALFGMGGNLSDKMAPAAAPVAAAGGGGAAPSGPALPQNAPVPTPSPMDAAIEATMGDASVLEAMQGTAQTPPAPAMEQGDAQVAEAMNGVAKTPLESAVDAQVAEPPAPAATPVAATTPAPTPPAQDSGGDNTALIVSTIAALGGAAGVASLIQRYRMGDPDAARTFEAIGMSPDDLSMFAGEPLGDGNTGTVSRVNTTSAAAVKPAAGRGNPATVAQKQKTKYSPTGEDVSTPRDEYPNGGRGIPKAKVKPKVK